MPAALPSAGSPLWYLSRGTGVVSLVLLTLVVVLGIVGSTRVVVPGLQRFVVAGLHRNASLLTLALLAVHISTAVLDPYAPIRAVDAVLPFASAYRPLWLGLGALALDLLLAVVATSLLRHRIGLRTWRVVHWATYAAWPVALLHGLGTGTDASRPWMLLVTFGSVAAVVSAVLYRVGQSTVAPEVQLGARGLVLAAPLVLAVWLVMGPLGAHWAARAGTPTQLLAQSRAAAASSSPAAAAPVPRGTGSVSGSVQVGGTSRSQVTIVLDGQLTDGLTGRLRVVLRGQALGSGGVALSSGSVSLRPDGAATYSGPVTGLDGGAISATLSGPAGPVQLSTSLTVDAGANRFTGQVTLG